MSKLVYFHNLNKKLQISGNTFYLFFIIDIRQTFKKVHCIVHWSTFLDPIQPNPWMEPTRVHLCGKWNWLDVCRPKVPTSHISASRVDSRMTDTAGWCNIAGMRGQPQFLMGIREFLGAKEQTGDSCPEPPWLRVCKIDLSSATLVKS